MSLPGLDFSQGWPATVRRVIVLALAWSLPISFSGMQGAVILGAGLLLVWTVAARGRNLAPTPMDRAVLWLLAAIGLSLLLAPRPPVSFQTATTFWVLVAFYVTYFLLDDAKTLKRAIVGLVSFACVASVFGIYQSVSGHYPLGETLHPHFPRDLLLKPAPGGPGMYGAVGFFYTRIMFSDVLVFPICWVAALGLEIRRWPVRLLLAGAGVVLLAGLAATWTRAPPVAVLAALLVMFVTGLRRGWPRRLGWLALVGSIGVFIAVVPLLPAKFSNAFSGKKDWGRLAIWQTGLDLASEKPLTGIGYGNYRRDAAGPIDGRCKQMKVRRFHVDLMRAHSNLLTFLAETGALGALGFCMLFIAYFRAARRRLARLAEDQRFLRGFVRGSMAAVGAFLLYGVLHDPFFRAEVIFTLCFTMGASLAVDRLASSRREGA